MNKAQTALFSLMLSSEIDRLAEGFKWAIDELQAPIAKNVFLGRNPNYWAQKSTSWWTPCSSHNRAILCKEKSTLFPNRYRSRIRYIVNAGHFSGGYDGPTKVRWPRSKIKGTYTSDWPKMAKNQGEPRKMTPISETENFFWVKIFSG